MENTVEQNLNPETNAFTDSASKTIADHLWNNKPLDFGLFMAKLELSVLMILFSLCKGNKSVLASILKIPRTTLTYKLKIPEKKNEDQL
jgi:DNA-binding protein Fis